MTPTHIWVLQKCYYDPKYAPYTVILLRIRSENFKKSDKKIFSSLAEASTQKVTKLISKEV